MILGTFSVVVHVQGNVCMLLMSSEVGWEGEGQSQNKQENKQLLGIRMYTQPIQHWKLTL